MTTTNEQIQAHNATQQTYYGTELEKKVRLLPTNSPYIRRHLAQTIHFGQLTHADAILEVGCGMGKYTLPLAQDGYTIEGLDLSADLLEHFTAHNTANLPIPLHCMDLLACPPALAGRFDVVLGFFTLHHLVDLTLCFKAMRHYLKPNGRVVFLEPNAFNPLYYGQILITPGMSWAGDKNIVHMTPRQLRRATADAGFGEFRLHRFGMFPPALTNRGWGARLEDGLDALRLFLPVSAFQVMTARLTGG